MTIGPLSMGLPEPLKTRPGGQQGVLENAQGQPGSLIATNPPHQHQLPPALHIPKALCTQLSTQLSPESCYMTISLGVFLSFLEIFIGKALAQNNYPNRVIWGLEGGEGRYSRPWEKIGDVQSISG